MYEQINERLKKLVTEIEIAAYGRELVIALLNAFYRASPDIGRAILKGVARLEQDSCSSCIGLYAEMMLNAAYAWRDAAVKQHEKALGHLDDALSKLDDLQDQKCIPKYTAEKLKKYLEKAKAAPTVEELEGKIENFFWQQLITEWGEYGLPSYLADKCLELLKEAFEMASGKKQRVPVV